VSTKKRPFESRLLAVSIDLKSNIQVSVLAAGQCVLCYGGGQKNQKGSRLLAASIDLKFKYSS
jgi:hypothetical protein